MPAAAAVAVQPRQAVTDCGVWSACLLAAPRVHACADGRHALRRAKCYIPTSQLCEDDAGKGPKPQCRLACVQPLGSSRASRITLRLWGELWSAGPHRACWQYVQACHKGQGCNHPRQQHCARSLMGSCLHPQQQAPRYQCFCQLLQACPVSGLMCVGNEHVLQRCREGRHIHKARSRLLA